MKDVTIIIVSYNTVDVTCEAIQSVYEQTQLIDFELIVVDNNSSDGSPILIGENFPDLQLIKLDSNIGFAAANNLAAKRASGRYILLLNPDTIVLNDAISILISWADAHPEWGVYGGRTYYPDGTINPTAGWMKPTVWSMFCSAIGCSKLFPKSRIFNRESIISWNFNRPRQVDIITGCFFLMRKKDWNKIGGFDHRYFMYGEDADLCLRAAEVNLNSVLVPEAGIIHYGGASEKVKSEKIIRLFRAKVQLFKRHYKSNTARILICLLYLRCLVRIYIFIITAPFSFRAKAQQQEWISIWRRRREWVEVVIDTKQKEMD